MCVNNTWSSASFGSSLLCQLSLATSICCYSARSNSGQAQSIRKLHSRLGEYRSSMGPGAGSAETTDSETAAALAHGDEALPKGEVSTTHRETELPSQSLVDAVPVGSSASSSPQHWVPLQEGSRGSDPLHDIHAHGRETPNETPRTYDACTQTNTIGMQASDSMTSSLQQIT